MSQYWIFKSEPSCYSVEDFKQEKKTWWTGVRNYQARNYMRQMTCGDKIFFYHSSCKEPGIVGSGVVCASAVLEETFDKGQWFCVQLAFEKVYEKSLSLRYLKALPEMASSPLVSKGNRLSIIPVTQEQSIALSQFLD